MTDDDSILFPSITICKKELFDHFKGLIKRLQTNEVSVENAGFFFRNRTFSRARLVKFLREVGTKTYRIFSVSQSDLTNTI